jgi:hypothetical protein
VSRKYHFHKGKENCSFSVFLFSDNHHRTTFCNTASAPVAQFSKPLYLTNYCLKSSPIAHLSLSFDSTDWSVHFFGRVWVRLNGLLIRRMSVRRRPLAARARNPLVRSSICAAKSSCPSRSWPIVSASYNMEKSQIWILGVLRQMVT